MGSPDVHEMSASLEVSIAIAGEAGSSEAKAASHVTEVSGATTTSRVVKISRAATICIDGTSTIVGVGKTSEITISDILSTDRYFHTLHL